jgi:aspartyl-tRNA(Asn)/glutamyl-tRNA(Gln) amidotransferase subunit A
MPDEQLCWLSAADLADAIARRAVSPVAVVDAHLARIERLNPRLNAFLTVVGDAARDAAQRAEKALAAGETLGPLHGVPFAVKDIIYTSGVRTTMGSRIFADFVPQVEATLVARLRAAGGILLAKAHTHEFAFGPTNENPHYGPCRNPWDPARITGGSSGGSGAAVAAGLCPIAIGSDTGGSIRIPAALCGVVGLKPTYGRVSRYGVFPLSWTTDHLGPLTRSVRDAALALRAIAGYDPRDPTTSRSAVPDYVAALTGDVRGLRVGLLREHLDAPLDEEVRAQFAAAVETLRTLGAQVEEVSVPSAGYAPVITGMISGIEAVVIHERHVRERAADYGPDVLHRLVPAFALTGADYVRAAQGRSRLIAETRAALQRCDVLASPTVPVPATEIGREVVAVGGRERAVRDYLARLTRLHNATGCPAISVPCGYTTSGLPVGLQIAGRPLDEAVVLRVADAYERATAGQRRRPPL